ncbi:MAG: lysophospholipase [Cyanobacteria bacterium]|nr:lysophospholipase [Cyanobacteriota bacterium]
MTTKAGRFLASRQRCYIFLLVAFLSIFNSNPSHATVIKDFLRYDQDALTMPAYAWSDTNVAPRAILIGLHGGVQHAGNYAALAERLAPQGILMYAIDFRGHGQWMSQSQERPKVDYEATASDVAKLATTLRAQHPELPLFVIGESLGAAMAMKAQSSNPKLFDGMILVSCGIRPVAKYHMVSTLKSVGQGVKTLGGTIDISSHVRSISEDPRSANEMLTDPLCRRQSSVWDLLRTVNFLHEAHRLAPRLNRDTPVLVLQGNLDHIVRPESTRELYTKLGSSKKSLIDFPDCGHLLVTTEYLKDNVVNTVEGWISDQIKQSHSVAETTDTTSVKG